MLLTTFDKELYEKGLKDDAYTEGQTDKLLEQIQKKVAKGKSPEQIADELEESVENIINLMEKLSSK